MKSKSSAGERLQLVGACPLVVTDVELGVSATQFLMTFQLGTLTAAQRETIIASGQEPSFLSDTMRQGIEHGGGLTGSLCTSALSVGAALRVTPPFLADC